MTYHVEITEDVLDPLAALDHCAAESHGAVDLFIGRVRNINDGQAVNAVSYDLQPALCRNIFAAICQEAIAQHGPDLKVWLAHRQGRLEIGEASVIAAASSRHRDLAFRACRFLVEQMKHRAPIWKQEHYVSGDSEWLEGHVVRS